MRENICNIKKCLGSHFLPDTKLTHGKRRRGWVCSGLQKARGIVVGTEEVGKYVCLKMKNPFFITANICLWLKANRCHHSLRWWCCLYRKRRPCDAALSFFNSAIVHIRGTLVTGEAVSAEEEGLRLRASTEIKIKHLDEWDKTN